MNKPGVFILLSLLVAARVPTAAQNNIDRPAYPEKVVPPAKVPVSEGFSTFEVKAEVPFPTEITDEAEARRITEEAALAWGKNRLMEYILTKETRSGKTLEVAQIPSLELQQQLRDYVATAKAESVHFEKKVCTLTVVLPKAPLKRILRKN